MNLIGKIFIVIIVVMAVLFMGLSMAVYSAHKNWPQEVSDTKARLAQVEAELARETNRYQRLESQLQAEIDTANQQVRKLEAERELLAQRNDAIQEEVNKLRAERAEATSMVASTQQNNARLADENTGLRDEIRVNQEARDVAFNKVNETTEQLHDTSIKLDAAVERNRQLVEQNGRYVTVIRNSGIDPNADLPKPMLDGFVSAIQKRPGSTLIEITLGADDGIKPGHTVEVYRDNKYLGRAQILKTAPDRSVGRIDAQLQKGQVLEGDRVATRLKLS
jgi:hypothetical protein